ncbi:SRPBCC family protein [Sphingomonas sp. ASV193]|uniref:aromatic ring-hydroxylating oxygenase subunit alpha n=1 Tax=Sphingomonas sp. ASV193 TaxID=3144405 RepID=UPI0032E8C9CB
MASPACAATVSGAPFAAMDFPLQPRRPTPGQRALAEALARGEAMMGEGIEQLPAATYTDPDRFAAEMRLFRTLPQLVAPSALLPEAVSAVAHDGYGSPLLLTRGADGRAHVLANACRHRGTRLVDGDEVVGAKRIVCPYHAWAYKPDGELSGMPRAECFPGFDRSANGLRAYPSAEIGGLLFYAEDEQADFSDLRALEPDFDAFGMAGLHLYERRVHDVAANWKLIVDAFLESYHVQRLHAQTIAHFFADGITVADRVGPHQRAAVGRAALLERADLDDMASLRRAVTFTYALFPASIVVVSPDYINLLVCMPQSVGRTLVEDYMLIPEPPQTNEAAAHWQKSWALLDGGAFGTEDFGAAARCYRGLASGTIETVTLGTLENGIADFHRRIDAALAR